MRGEGFNLSLSLAILQMHWQFVSSIQCHLHLVCNTLLSYQVNRYQVSVKLIDAQSVNCYDAELFVSIFHSFEAVITNAISISK